MKNPFDPFEILNKLPESYDPKNTLGDDEFAIQFIKIFIGIIGLLSVCTILWHINSGIDRLNVQNGQIIELLKK